MASPDSSKKCAKLNDPLVIQELCIIGSQQALELAAPVFGWALRMSGEVK